MFLVATIAQMTREGDGRRSDRHSVMFWTAEQCRNITVSQCYYNNQDSLTSMSNAVQKVLDLTLLTSLSRSCYTQGREVGKSQDIHRMEALRS